MAREARGDFKHVFHHHHCYCIPHHWYLQEIRYDLLLNWMPSHLEGVVAAWDGLSLPGNISYFYCSFYVTNLLGCGNPCQAIEKEGFLELGQLNLPSSIKPAEGNWSPASGMDAATAQNGAIKRMALNSNWKCGICQLGKRVICKESLTTFYGRLFTHFMSANFWGFQHLCILYVLNQPKIIICLGNLCFERMTHTVSVCNIRALLFPCFEQVINVTRAGVSRAPN